MADITAAMVKELRERSGAGMMDAKKALTATDGDMDAAIDWLREKGVVKSIKKGSRVAAEGLVGLAVKGDAAAIVEVNSETDFVARNADFQEMVGEIATVALSVEGDDVDALKSATMPSSGKSVEEHVRDKVATIGENMGVRRFQRVSVATGAIASYVHNASADGMGNIGVLAVFESDGDKEKVAAFGKQICMHIAAIAPASLDVDDLDPEMVEREKQVLSEQARQSGKPENVIEKMIVGRMNKYYQEVVLLKQPFALNNDVSVEKAIADFAKELGSEVALTGFVRLKVGEGVEKEETDFAAEVAAQVNKD